MLTPLQAATEYTLRGWSVIPIPHRSKNPGYGSFEGWSRLVREAIVWAGQPDPCLTRDKLAERSDTTADVLGQLLVAWAEYDIAQEGFVVGELLTRLYPRSLWPSDTPSVEMRAALENLVGCLLAESMRD